MKIYCGISILLLFVACSQKKISPPEGEALQLQLATEGAGRFEDYIQDLSIYAFRQTAEGGFVYDKTVAELDAQAIAGLEDGADQGTAKYFKTNLRVGTYELYVVGNAAGQIAGPWIEGVTTPADVLIRGSGTGQDSIFFLGQIRTQVLSEYDSPVKITLNRMVSKLVLLLYGIPVQIDTVQIRLGNIAEGVYFDGQLTSGMRTLQQSLAVRHHGQSTRDTLVAEFIVLPSVQGESPLQLSFHAVNGQERVKTMPSQALLPDKFIRVTGEINDRPGGLLDLDIKMNILLVDYWLDRALPDFTLTPRSE